MHWNITLVSLLRYLAILRYNFWQSQICILNIEYMHLEQKNKQNKYFLLHKGRYTTKQTQQNIPISPGIHDFDLSHNMQPGACWSRGLVRSAGNIYIYIYMCMYIWFSVHHIPRGCIVYIYGCMLYTNRWVYALRPVSCPSPFYFMLV